MWASVCGCVGVHVCVYVAYVVFEKTQNDKNVNHQILDFVHTIPVRCYKFTKCSVKVDFKLVASFGDDHYLLLLTWV